MLFFSLGLTLLLATPAPTAPPATTAATTTTATATATTAATATTTATTAQRLLVLDLAAVGVDDNAARTITGVVSSLVDECSGVEAMSGADIRTMMSVAADQQILGCDDATCLGELANALGARYVVSGDVGRLGERYVVNLALFDSEKALSAGRRTVEVASLESMSAELLPAINALLAPLGGIPLTTTARADSGSVLVPIGGITLGVGVVAAGVGTALALIAEGTAGNTEKSVADKTAAIDSGRGWLIVAGVGGVVAVAGAGVLLAGLLSE